MPAGRSVSRVRGLHYGAIRMGDDTTTAYRTCPLCEATCGLEITLRGDDVIRIRGDREDVFSHGFICPKGSTLKQLHTDPDRLRRPLVKRDGAFVEVSWPDAFAEIARRVPPIVAEHGPQSVMFFRGNPGTHDPDLILYHRNVVQAIATRNVFSSATADQRPKELASALMFGSVSIALPDLDRTDHVLLLGTNPVASNGSLCTAPDFVGRLRAIQARGGTVVVVDPRRTETAEMADRHVAIRPGTDAHLLAAMAHTLLAEELAEPGRLAEHAADLDRLPELLAPFTPERAARACGVDADTIRALARGLAAAPSAAVHGRMGTTTQEFGSLASWLVDVVNLLTGNLDRVGGVMWATPAAGHPALKGKPGVGRGVEIGAYRSRVEGLAEVLGELPVGTMATEILTPGPGQVRAAVVLAGNPVASTPDSARLDEALASLEFMVSVDIYLNETTRHADVVLPPPSALQRSHYDVVFWNLAIRNVANYSPPVLGLGPDDMEGWEILLRLVAALQGDTEPDIATHDELVALARLASAARDPSGPAHGRDPDEMLAMCAGRRGPERLLDIMLRTGPYGDGFGARPGGLTLAALEARPHGIDFGPMEPGQVPDRLRTPSGKIECAPEAFVADLPRLRASLDRAWDESMVLIGRRHIRSNNSWMHNVDVLMKGRNRCTLLVHPDDADRLGLVDGGPARVTSEAGEVVVTAELSDTVRPGVVSLPHGFGQGGPGVRLAVASEYRGVNSNVLTPAGLRDEASGTAVLNGIPVTLVAG